MTTITAPPPMSSAGFKTLHEALGVSTAFLSERIGVSTGRVWEYESPTRSIPVPDHAAEVIRGLAAQFDAAVQRLAGEARLGGSVPRYADHAEFMRAFPELADWGQATQGLLVAQVQRETGAPVEYVR